jgi:PTS system nitrogen regulatory IIA component
MYEYQITFIVHDVNASARIVSPLIRLAKKFKSIFHIINITKNCCAELNKSLSVFKVGLHVGDLCQISAIGIDAELACFVIKDIVAEHFTLVGAKTHPLFSQNNGTEVVGLNSNIPIDWYYAKAQSKLSQFECLSGLAKLIYPSEPDELVLAFIKREERSSTCMFPGIALPHVMSDTVEQVTLAVITSDNPIDWCSNMGGVHIAIALVLPDKASKEQIIAATNLTRNLLCEPIGERLLLTRNRFDLHAILIYLTSRLLS